MTNQLQNLKIKRVALVDKGANPHAEILIRKRDTGTRDALIAKAIAYIEANPSVTLAEAVTAVANERLGEAWSAPVAKAGGTLADWCDSRIASRAREVVTKSSTATYATALRDIAQEHPGLVAMRHSFAGPMPMADGVAALTKFAAETLEWGEQQQVISWLTELR